MSDIRHILGVGKLGDDINNDFIPLELGGFTFDSMEITFDSMVRTFDEI